MSNKSQIEKDQAEIANMYNVISERGLADEIARKALHIANKYIKKSENQRIMLNQISKGGMCASCDHCGAYKMEDRIRSYCKHWIHETDLNAYCSYWIKRRY